ncbi:methyltransferase domain-containing protein [Nocardia mexicana]|uniref:Methyltransferase family protein n=1 Tax=Nocardia mexicana TaxID=279262 RepID=A0A370H6Z8_9NOCA|nr:methyltransferase domain-containing protein [Nocardia mexicana]RDI52133.1 methyltransferase family protein [Nocardia mexicana]
MFSNDPAVEITDIETTTGNSPVDYVHGYGEDEAERLVEQADLLAAMVHDGTRFTAGARVLEAGCGVGAQTVHLLRRSPEIALTGLDRSRASLDIARSRVAACMPEANVEWVGGDLYEPPFAEDSFDHVFVCFVLEHVRSPARILRSLRRVLRPGGSITLVEGDHGFDSFRPDSAYARKVIDSLVRVQSDADGDALVGRKLHGLLAESGYADIVTFPRPIRVDSDSPRYAKEFARNTHIPMIEAVRDKATGSGYISRDDWDQGISDLYRTASEGVLSVTFMKATAIVSTA